MSLSAVDPGANLIRLIAAKSRKKHIAAVSTISIVTV
jgi:hypothetical protein